MRVSPDWAQSGCYGFTVKKLDPDTCIVLPPQPFTLVVAEQCCEVIKAGYVSMKLHEGNRMSWAVARQLVADTDLVHIKRLQRRFRGLTRDEAATHRRTKELVLSLLSKIDPEAEAFMDEWAIGRGCWMYNRDALFCPPGHPLDH